MDGLNDLAIRINETARSKGWWRGTEVECGDSTVFAPRPVAEVLALVHSEVSEALEEYRAGHDLRRIRYVHEDGRVCTPEELCRHPQGTSGPAKPEGFPIELADIFIRLLDAAAEWDIDLQEAVEVKMAYNSTRPERHGGKLA